jgi:hypothetical protein
MSAAYGTPAGASVENTRMQALRGRPGSDGVCSSNGTQNLRRSSHLDHSFACGRADDSPTIAERLHM